MTRTLCHKDDLSEGSARGFHINNAQIFAVKYDGEVYVYENRCPHLEINLEWQENDFLDADKTFIQCATHGALFEIQSGRCISGPCLGDKLTDVPFEVDSSGNVKLLPE